MLEQVDKAWKKGISEIGQHNRDAVIVHFPEDAAEAIYVCVDMYRGAWRDVYLDQHTLAELPASSARVKEVNGAAWLRRMKLRPAVGETGGIAARSSNMATCANRLLVCRELRTRNSFESKKPERRGKVSSRI